jgi:hypothetical protein
MRSNTQHAFLLRGSAAVLVFVCSCFAQAQSQSAIISGTVRDITGAAVPKAEIALMTNSVRVLQTTADNTGSFTIEGTPGEYALTASSPGFTAFIEIVHLTANAPTVKQVVLKVAACGDHCENQPEQIQLLSEQLNLLVPLEPIPPLTFHSRRSKSRST